MAKSNASGLLTSLDSLFTTQEQRDAAKRDVVLDLPLDQIGDFPNHPFKVRQDDAMMEMMESVQLHGVLVPGLVRQLADGSYQMVSGHRRKLASRLAGLDTHTQLHRHDRQNEISLGGHAGAAAHPG